VSEYNPNVDPVVDIYRCPACEGKGLQDGKFCESCNGVGVWGIYRGHVLYAPLPRVVTMDSGFWLRYLMEKLAAWFLGSLAVGGMLAGGWSLIRELENILLFEEEVAFSLLSGLFFVGALSGIGWLFWRIVGRFPSQPFPIDPDAKNEELPTEIASNWNQLREQRASRYFIDCTALVGPSARRALYDTLRAVQKRGQRVLWREHLFLILLGQSRIRQAALRLNLDVDSLYKEYERLVARQDAQGGNEVIVSTELKAVIIQSLVEADQLGRPYLHDADLFLAMTITHEAISLAIKNQHISSPDIRQVIYWLEREEERKRWWRKWSIQHFRRAGKLDRGWSSGWTMALDRYSRDLTKMARKGLLQDCVGRESETTEIAQILGRSSKSSVLMVGESGVGRTSIVEGLAHRIMRGEVEDTLRNKRIVELNMGALLGASANANAFSDQMTRILQELGNSKNVILFIKNLHALRGVGAGEGSGLDAFGMIEPSLSRGEFQCIAMTSPKEFVRYIESNESLARCFVNLEVKEPAYEDTIKILQEVVLAFERKHKVMVSYPAIVAAIELSTKYIQGHMLPDKAVDLLDEATVLVSKRDSNRIVGREDIATIVSAKTNIPLSDITVDESDRLLNLEQELHSRLVGQEEAVTAVANAIRRARVGLRDTSKPMASFLFVGTTGVGKTELAKTVAQTYFGDERSMIRLDMSEFQEVSSIQRLLGVPGQAEGGILTEAVRKRPYSLILLDEFEKAYSDIHNIFLQVFDDGRLTDGNGRVINFSNTILIATSNAGSTVIRDGVAANRPLAELREHLLREVLITIFRPELVNRFDDIILFRPLNQKEVFEIARRMLMQIHDKLKQQDILFKITEEAIARISEMGFDPVNGARPLRRVIQQKVEDPVTQKILKNEILRGDTLIIRANDIV